MKIYISNLPETYRKHRGGKKFLKGKMDPQMARAIICKRCYDDPGLNPMGRNELLLIIKSCIKKEKKGGPFRDIFPNISI